MSSPHILRYRGYTPEAQAKDFQFLPPRNATFQVYKKKIVGKSNAYIIVCTYYRYLLITNYESFHKITDFFRK